VNNSATGWQIKSSGCLKKLEIGRHPAHPAGGFDGRVEEMPPVAVARYFRHFRQNRKNSSFPHNR
jgi:hypothetical protein